MRQPRTSRMLALGLGAVALLLAAACGEKDTDAKMFAKCDPDKHCAEPSVCLSFTEDPKRGYCLKPCDTDSECPKGLRCTGRHRRSAGAVDTYCRKPTVGLGGDCSKPGKGCQLGLRCFEGKCQKVCRTDAQCADPKTRCVPILVDALTSKEQKKLFDLCLVAEQTEGKKCADVGPFCARNHFCHEKKCLKGCTADKDCGKRRICDGQLYLGKGAKKRAQTKQKPDRRFCRGAAKRGRPCHHNLYLSCRRGLKCVKFHCRKVRTVGVGHACNPDRAVYCKKGAVCYKTQCRRTCLSDDDCPQGRGLNDKVFECHERIVRKRKVMLCL